jgi:hypothetical protein
MTARSESIPTIVALVLLGGQLACKLHEPARSPEPLVDDIAKIEAALEQREGELGRAGIVVAQRSPSLDAGRTEPPAEPVDDATAPELANDEETKPAQSEAPAVAAEPIEASSAQDSSVTQERARRAGRTARNRAKRSKIALGGRTPTRCETICGLAETTCELRERVCAMTEDHPDDVRYEAACRRAEDQCSAATEHCDRCAV